MAIVYFELNGSPLLSRLAAIFPIFTSLAYLFIGRFSTDKAVASHALFVLLGTIFCWTPYMLAIYLLTPKIGSTWALVLAITIFLLLSVIFVEAYKL